MYLYLYLYTYVCIYVYMYTHTYIHTFIYPGIYRDIYTYDRHIFHTHHLQGRGPHVSTINPQKLACHEYYYVLSTVLNV